MPKVCGKSVGGTHIIAIVGIALAVGIAVGVIVMVTQDDTRPTDPPTMTTTAAPPTIADEERIDCYPEEHWANPKEVVDQEKCESRGCSYSTSQNEAAPSCYIDAESKLGQGYNVDGDVHETELGFYVNLTANEEHWENTISSVTFEVEYRTRSALRFKVSVLLS